MNDGSSSAKASRSPLVPADPVSGRDSIYTQRARYYTPLNSFAFSLPAVPCRRFTDERDAALAAPGTGWIALDLARELASDFPLTTPTMLMRYGRIAAGETLSSRFAASTEVYYVIEGAGVTTNGTDRIAWRAGDVFVLPGGDETKHTANDAGALLFCTTNEPLLAFERARAPLPGAAQVQAVHYPAESLAAQMDLICDERGQKQQTSKAILLTSTAMDRTATCAPTITVGLNIFEPGDNQRPHLHNAVAVTFVIRAKPGAHSMVDDQRVDWETNLVLPTPPRAVHSHHNESDEPMIALVIQDGGLYYHTRTPGFDFAD